MLQGSSAAVAHSLRAGHAHVPSKPTCMHRTLLLCCRVVPALRLRLYPPVLAAAACAHVLSGLCPLSDYVPLMDALGLAVKLKRKQLLPEVSLQRALADVTAAAPCCWHEIVVSATLGVLAASFVEVDTLSAVVESCWCC